MNNEIIAEMTGVDHLGIEAPGSILRWFAVTVHHQHEKILARRLADLGLESFLPLYRTRRIWSDRVKDIELPLFSRYVFVRFAFRNRAEVLRTPGVRTIVGRGKETAYITEPEIAALKAMVSSGLPVEPWPYLKTGDWVRITHGPLQGLEGILVRQKDSWRVVLSVQLLQRSVAAEVDRLGIAPAKRVPQTA
jgi:transcription antitermination factor NusG